MDRQGEDGDRVLLSLEGVYAGYRRNPVLRDINLTLPESSITVVMGRNGAGKTTLLKTIGGLTRVFRGRIIIDGRDVTGRPPWARGAALFLNPHPLIEAKTVLENLDIAVKMTRKAGRSHEEPRRVAQLMGVEELLHRRVGELSRGLKQLVGLAQVFVSRPRIILMDEPFTNLDYFYRARLWELMMRAVREWGLSIVMTTHDLTDIVLSGGTRVIVIEKGRIVGQLGEDDLVRGSPVAMRAPLPNLFFSFVARSSSIGRLLASRCGVTQGADGGDYVALPPSLIKVHPDTGFSRGDCDAKGVFLGTRILAPGLVLGVIDVNGQILYSPINDMGFHGLSELFRRSVCIKFEC